MAKTYAYLFGYGAKLYPYQFDDERPGGAKTRRSQISTTGMEPTRIQTRISPRHICGPLTSLAGHETHTHRAAVALLANSLPGHETHMHNAFIFNRGV